MGRLGIARETICPEESSPKNGRKVAHATLELRRKIFFGQLQYRRRFSLGFGRRTVTTLVLPNALLKGKSPFENLFLRPPSLHHLRVFGGLCYATNMRKTDKFSPRAFFAVHLGYSSSQKVYLLYDLSTQHFFVSMDIVLKKDIFPFQHLQSGHSPIFPVLQLSALDAPVSCPEVVKPIVEIEAPMYEMPSPTQSTGVPSTAASHASLPPLKKSSIVSKPPIWMKDYVVHTKQSTCAYPIAQYVNYDQLSSAYMISVATYSTIFEPKVI
ncbi:uncharacterized protein [Nicotiana sylvestris]|uniref:Uncharacterized protein LOC104240235 n=1 Tax=Nicotiana sylvestris TaxID=4096 RepID=A0A1U7Y3G2_NICSY|nr:PREDICTED: uncharacterized protein LOC104240235 [Nicotiana sylvestris]